MRSSQDVMSRLSAHEPRHLEELREFLRFPSISTDPAHAQDVKACARYLVRQLEAMGLAAECLDLGGHPLVYGEWTGAPGRPTLLVYGHYHPPRLLRRRPSAHPAGAR